LWYPAFWDGTYGVWAFTWSGWAKKAFSYRSISKMSKSEEERRRIFNAHKLEKAVDVRLGYAVVFDVEEA
jgi:hypothetical protein